MKLEVNKDLCIGCGMCCGIEPDVFEIGDDGLSYVKVDEIKEENKENALDAVDGCPTSAIEKIEEEK